MSTYPKLLFISMIFVSCVLFAQTQSEVFNVNVYEGIYPDLFNAYGSNTSGATNHWLNQGLPVEGRKASVIFDVQYYIAHNSGVPTSYTAALQDFMANGLPAGKRGSLDSTSNIIWRVTPIWQPHSEQIMWRLRTIF